MSLIYYVRLCELCHELFDFQDCTMGQWVVELNLVISTLSTSVDARIRGFILGGGCCCRTAEPTQYWLPLLIQVPNVLLPFHSFLYWTTRLNSGIWEIYRQSLHEDTNEREKIGESTARISHMTVNYKGIKVCTLPNPGGCRTGVGGSGWGARVLAITQIY